MKSLYQTFRGQVEKAKNGIESVGQKLGQGVRVAWQRAQVVRAFKFQLLVALGVGTAVGFGGSNFGRMFQSMAAAQRGERHRDLRAALPSAPVQHVERERVIADIEERLATKRARQERFRVTRLQRQCLRKIGNCVGRIAAGGIESVVACEGI